MKTLLSLLLLSVLPLLSPLAAQKISGEWELMQRAGDDGPCAVDALVAFAPQGGAATLIHGSRAAGCTPSSQTFAGWSIDRVEIKLRVGGAKKVRMIQFRDASGTVEEQWRLLEYEDDFMLVLLMTPSGDTTEAAKMIFKRTDAG